jgi:N-methyl-L-proline demethylase
MADACHEHGTAIMMQVTHLGRRTNWNKADWLPVLAPSPLREPAHRAFPKEMEDYDFTRIISAFADAAERLKAGGFDGMELECYGHLMDGFWSPLTNKRADEWGGTLDNRLRFSMLIIDAVRKRVGPDFIVGARLVADEDHAQGISKAEGLEICKRIISTGHVDFLNIIRGHIEHDAPLQKVIPTGGMPSAPHLDFSGEVRAATKFPTFHAARINDVATARHAIASGKLDMVGMTRAHMADPYIVAKIMAGEEATIRPCVGATYCIDRIYEGHEALCIHNAATGREASMPHVVARAAVKRRIVIVGAGPAGLEAARVCAERGHKVTVFEAAPEAGGQMRMIWRSKRRSEMRGIIDWRLADCARLGAEIRYNTLADENDIVALEPDSVLIATGGLAQRHPMVGGSELAVSGWDILSGDIPPGKDVLLYDDHGGQQGLMVAEFLGEAGAQLELVTPERFFAPDVGGLNHVSYMRALQTKNVRITICTKLLSVKRDGNRLAATLGSDYSDRIETRLVDQVVVEHGTLPLDDLYFALKPKSMNLGEIDYAALIAGKRQAVLRNSSATFQLFRIGDAVAHRNIHAAIYDALRLCKDL